MQTVLNSKTNTCYYLWSIPRGDLLFVGELEAFVARVRRLLRLRVQRSEISLAKRRRKRSCTIVQKYADLFVYFFLFECVIYDDVPSDRGLSVYSVWGKIGCGFWSIASSNPLHVMI